MGDGADAITSLLRRWGTGRVRQGVIHGPRGGAAVGRPGWGGGAARAKPLEGGPACGGETHVGGALWAGPGWRGRMGESLSADPISEAHAQWVDGGRGPMGPWVERYGFGPA
eukprot:8297142-Pyramimonas_sp.AAC.1